MRHRLLVPVGFLIRGGWVSLCERFQGDVRVVGVGEKWRLPLYPLLSVYV